MALVFKIQDTLYTIMSVLTRDPNLTNELPTGRAGQAVRRRPRLHQEDHGQRGAPLLLARQPGQRSQVNILTFYCATKCLEQ